MSSLGYPALSRTVKLSELKQALILSSQAERCVLGAHSPSDSSSGERAALRWAAKQSGIGCGAEPGPPPLPAARRWATRASPRDAVLPAAALPPGEPGQKVPSWLQSGRSGDANPSSAVGTKLKLG